MNPPRINSLNDIIDDAVWWAATGDTSSETQIDIENILMATTHLCSSVPNRGETIGIVDAIGGELP